MKTDKMVLNTDPEAASIKTVTGWVSKDGMFWGDNERQARWCGCTHVKCETCGTPVEKGWLKCRSCRDKIDKERFLAMPEEDWDGKAMVYSQTLDKYFSSPEEAFDEAEWNGEVSKEELDLVICKPIYASELTPEYWCDELPGEEHDVPGWLDDAIDEFNAKLKGQEPLSWEPGNKRLRL